MELWQYSSLILQSAEQHKNKMQQVSWSLEKHQDVKPTPLHWTKKLFRIYPVESQGSPRNSTQALTVNSRFVMSVFLLQLCVWLFIFVEGKFKANVCVYSGTKILLSVFIVL
jgi:hypothetical protein